MTKAELEAKLAAAKRQSDGPILPNYGNLARPGQPHTGIPDRMVADLMEKWLGGGGFTYSGGNPHAKQRPARSWDLSNVCTACGATREAVEDGYVTNQCALSPLFKPKRVRHTSEDGRRQAEEALRTNFAHETTGDDIIAALCREIESLRSENTKTLEGTWELLGWRDPGIVIFRNRATDKHLMYRFPEGYGDVRERDARIAELQQRIIDKDRTIDELKRQRAPEADPNRRYVFPYRS